MHRTIMTGHALMFLLISGGLASSPLIGALIVPQKHDVDLYQGQHAICTAVQIRIISFGYPKNGDNYNRHELGKRIWRHS
jgi:hypothetical protein